MKMKLKYNTKIWMATTLVLILATCWVPIWPIKSEQLTVGLYLLLLPFELPLILSGSGGEPVLLIVPATYLLLGWVVHVFVGHWLGVLKQRKIQKAEPRLGK